MLLKLKPKISIRKYFSSLSLFILLALAASNFLVPNYAQASGNVYDFSNIKLTESIDVSSNASGPWTNINFIRVGQDADFYVKVTIQVASLTNHDGQVVTQFDTSNDAIYNPGFTTTNFAITGVGPSLVAKVSDQQAAAIKAAIASGTDPSKVGGIPCYKQTLTSGGSALVNGVVIVGAATAVALSGGTLAAGALAAGGTAAGTAVGADAVALTIAYNSTAVAAGAAAGTAAGLATFVPIGPSDYIKCDGPVRPPAQSKGVVKVGDVLFSDVVAVPASTYKSLGMSQLADSSQNASTQPVNEFFTVPDVYFQSWLGLRNDFMSSLGAGKSVYVQLYDTQANADKHKSDAVPSSVPNNGSNTGSGNNVNSAGSPLLGLLNSLIGFILGLLQELIYAIFFYILAPVIQSMLSIHPYTDTFVAVIYPGWVIVRNICNIFFIVALIIIAMATLFRIEAYKYRDLLVQLIIAALLINFSLVIAQAVLGLADTVQAQFLPANVTVIRSLAGDLMVGWRSSVFSSGTVFSGTFAGTIQPIFWLALSLGSFAVFAAIAVFLVIRIVALWVLLLISPIAYAVGVLPSTAHYRDEWWGYFLKYAFFTPIMAFFLNLTAVISNTYKTNPVLQQIGGANLQNSLGGDSLATFVFAVASNVLLLVFLLVGLMVADKFGIMGASAVTGAAKKYGVLGAFGLAKVGAERGFEGVQNSTGITMDPRIWAAKYKEYSEREKHKRLEKRADQNIGIGNWRINDSAKIGLGSPLDFYKNYANWQGARRMGRNLKMRTKTAFHEMSHAEDALKDVRQQGNIMTDVEFSTKQQELTNAQDKYRDMVDRAKLLLKEKNGFEETLQGFEADEDAGTLSEDNKKRMQPLRVKIAERERALAKMGASKFAEDENGKEVLLQDFAQDTELKEAQVQEKDLEAKVQEDVDKFNAYRVKPGKETYQRQNQGERDALAQQLRDLGEAYKKAQTNYFGRRLPEAYHARAARQSLEAEEEKKVSDIKSWPEKVQVFLSAQAEQNPYLAAAVLKSLAKDSNFNEIVEGLGYSSSAEGLKQLFEKEYRDKFGLTQHQMMQVATEVGYVNEDAGWWNMARVSDIDRHGHVNWQIDTSGNGEWRRTVAAQVNKVARGAVTQDQMKALSEEQLQNFKPEDITVAGVNATEAYGQKWAPQNNEISVEMEKRGARLIANFARTSFVNQTLGPEGHMTTGIHRAGRNVLQAMSKTQNTIYEFSRMLRPNTAKAISSAKEWNWQYCKDNRIDREIYEKITKMAGKPLEPL